MTDVGEDTLISLVSGLSAERFILRCRISSTVDILSIGQLVLDGNDDVYDNVPKSVTSDVKQLVGDYLRVCADPMVAKYLLLSMIEGVVMCLQLGKELDMLGWNGSADEKVRRSYSLAIAITAIATEYECHPPLASIRAKGVTPTGSEGNSDWGEFSRTIGLATGDAISELSGHLSSILDTVHIASTAGVAIGSIVSGILRKAAPVTIVALAAASIAGAAGSIQLQVLNSIMAKMDMHCFWDFVSLLLCRNPLFNKVGRLKRSGGEVPCLYLDYRFPVDPGIAGKAMLKVGAVAGDTFEAVPIAKAVVERNTFPLAALWPSVHSLPKMIVTREVSDLEEKGWVIFEDQRRFLRTLGFSEEYSLPAFCGVIDIPSEYAIAVRK